MPDKRKEQWRFTNAMFAVAGRMRAARPEPVPQGPGPECFQVRHADRVQ